MDVAPATRRADQVEPQIDTRPILFLDFDGVLNGEDFLAERAETPSGELWTENDLDRSRVALLNRILANSGACIVISSSWRHHHSLPELASILMARGLVGEIVGATPRMSGEPRGVEILTWLAANRSEESRFVVLDDEQPSGGLDGSWVRTSPLVGLQAEDVGLALEILSRSSRS